MTGLNDFLPDKHGLRRNFNASARRYEETAVLQMTVAQRLDERLECVLLDPKLALDLGSGTGAGARLLRSRYGRPRIVHADIASNMLHSARRRAPRLWSREWFVCADAEALPFPDARYDLVYSNLMLQWCSDPGLVFAQVARVLKPGGLFLFSSMGPDTLRELRDSWAQVDDGIHVNAFIDMHDLGDALVRNGFEAPVMEVEYFTLTYPDVQSLMRDLKSLGAQNVTRGRRRSLTGKGRMQQLAAAYETFRSDGRLPASYEIVYGHAWCRGVRSERPREPREVSIPVSALRRGTGTG